MVEVNIKGDEVIRRLLELRSRELGETTQQSATAIMVTAIKSIRGNTQIANPKHGKHIKIRNVTSQYRPTWKTKDGARKFSFVSGNSSTEVKAPDGVRLVFDNGIFGRKTFYCEDIRSPDKIYRYMIVTNESSRAKEIVDIYHNKRVNRYRKLARYALGIAMAKLASNTGLENVNDKVKKSTLNNVIVESHDSGFNSGNVSISVKDTLDYAGKALKSGESFISEAMNRAVNQTVGLLMQRLKRKGTLDDSLRQQFESLKSS